MFFCVDGCVSFLFSIGFAALWVFVVVVVFLVLFGFDFCGLFGSGCGFFVIVR